MDYQIILDNMPTHLREMLVDRPIREREDLLILYHIENNPNKIEDILKMSGVKNIKFCDCLNGYQGIRVIKGKNEKPIICRCTMRMIANNREGNLLVNWKGFE